MQSQTNAIPVWAIRRYVLSPDVRRPYHQLAFRVKFMRSIDEERLYGRFAIMHDTIRRNTNLF